ncbi:MAG: nucleotidyltransferase family protein [Burkholderiales bacterium]|nr:nucleotidyltransferase family protein [Burkholderiales bacterium]
MQAIVLAGGLGTRLRSAVPDLPKPMAPVAGRPFLAWILDQLEGAGFARAVLAVGYRHEAIRDHFGDRHGALALRYSVEDRPLGTGGALRLACDQAYDQADDPAGDDAIFVLNGDTFVELDHRAMRAAHGAAGAALSIAVHRVDDTARYGALELRDGRVCGFIEKGRRGPGWINAGVYLLARGLLRQLPAGRALSFEQELLVPQVRSLRPPAFVAEGLFIDIGVPEDYARAQGLFARRAARH